MGNLDLGTPIRGAQFYMAASDYDVPNRRMGTAEAATASPAPSNRKLSFPASLHASLLGLATDGGKDAATTKRRFSNVGDAVTRKLSSTIGWANSNVPPEGVVLQGRALCGQYIKRRLKRSGIFSKKLCLYRFPSDSSAATTVRDVFPFLMATGLELERMHPKLYTGVSRQATTCPGGVLVSDMTVAGLLVAIGQELLKADVTWGKVVSIFAVAGGLAVDCVCQGHPEYLHGLIRGVTEILEDNVALWVATNGGWSTLCGQCKCPKATSPSSPETVFTAILIIIALLFGYLMVYFTQRLGYI